MQWRCSSGRTINGLVARPDEFSFHTRFTHDTKTVKSMKPQTHTSSSAITSKSPHPTATVHFGRHRLPRCRARYGQSQPAATTLFPISTRREAMHPQLASAEGFGPNWRPCREKHVLQRSVASTGWQAAREVQPLSIKRVASCRRSAAA